MGIWTNSIIQKYEDRPRELEDLYLADFVVAWYTPVMNRAENSKMMIIVTDVMKGSMP